LPSNPSGNWKPSAFADDFVQRRTRQLVPVMRRVTEALRPAACRPHIGWPRSGSLTIFYARRPRSGDMQSHDFISYEHMNAERHPFADSEQKMPRKQVHSAYNGSSPECLPDSEPQGEPDLRHESRALGAGPTGITRPAWDRYRPPNHSLGQSGPGRSPCGSSIYSSDSLGV
jgi:hypothetical protein